VAGGVRPTLQEWAKVVLRKQNHFRLNFAGMGRWQLDRTVYGRLRPAVHPMYASSEKIIDFSPKI